MDNNFIQKVYYLFLFFSLISLVFYAGFLFGNRERVNQQPDNFKVTNPNGQSLNTISQIQQRPVEGSKNGRNIEIFGQMFFLVNSQNQTEIVIQLSNIPARIVTPDNLNQVEIPQVLKIQIARRVRDVDGGDTYKYENLGLNESTQATVSLSEPVNGLRNGTFSGYIKEPVIDESFNRSGIERVVLFPLDDSNRNIFIDQNPDLPIKIRGNAQAGIPGQPAPFFWIRL